MTKLKITFGEIIIEIEDDGEGPVLKIENEDEDEDEVVGIVSPAPTQDTTGNGHTAVPELSRREGLILANIAKGLSNKEIARNLVITESTVKVHMKALLRKLRLKNRTQAAIWATHNDHGFVATS